MMQTMSVFNKTKWLATFLVVVSTALNSLAIYPLGPLVNIIAGLLWLVVAVAWGDRALVVTNITITFVCIIGLLINFGII